MATWLLAPTLVVLRDEINKAWPLRDKTSGGAIGNLAHQQSKSDHNPDSRGVVCAIDIDEDLDRPASAHLSFHTGQAVKAVLVDKLIANAKAGKLPQLYYVIYERKIYSQTYGFAARDYSGASAQDHHVHVSVYHDEARADSTAPWGITNDVVETKLRCVSLNVRNKTAVADIPFPSRHWSKRLPALIKYIQHVGPSVIGVQECGNSMAVDLTNGLGPSWTFWGAGTSKVIWNTAKWTAVDQFETTMPFKEFGVTKARPLTMVKLRSVKTGGECWFVSTHFTVNITGLDQSATRREQMRLVIKHLSERPAYERALIMGDFNDSSETSGVRAVAKAAGYKTLRAALSDEAMVGDSTNTFNGWKPTKHESRWIDDVLTSKAVKPYGGEVELTDASRWGVYASDHNGVRASVAFSQRITSSVSLAPVTAVTPESMPLTHG